MVWRTPRTGSGGVQDDSLGGHDQALVGAPAHPREIVVTLRDGARVTVRPIRPQDAAALRAGFERLSEQSRYRRFLSPMQDLSGSMLRYLTEVDHHDHEALIAVGAEGTLVGVARSVRSHGDPQVAEAAVTVADDWQGVGCLYSIGGAGGECPSREKPLETDACVQSTGPQQSRQRSTAGERKTAAFQSPIEFWHPTGLIHEYLAA
jgi:hypothetical protein